MEAESNKESQRSIPDDNEFQNKLEATKKSIMHSVSAPTFDEVDKLKQEIEFKTRTLKQKEAEAVKNQLDALEKTKEYYKELMM